MSCFGFINHKQLIVTRTGALMKTRMDFNPYINPYQTPYQTMKQEIDKKTIYPGLPTGATRGELLMLIDVLQNDLLQIKRQQASLQARIDKSGIPY